MSGGAMETYLTIEELAGHLKLAAQTIRRYVLNREIPFHKIRKVVRFRLSEIERWIDNGGVACPVDEREGDLAGLWPDAGVDETTGETGCQPRADSRETESEGGQT